MVRTIDRPPARPSVDERGRPWWHSGRKVLVACVAAAVVGLGGGLALSRHTTPGPTSIDVRFLQDMRWHHDQGVGMAITALERTDTSAGVRSRAKDIVLDQQLQNGTMVQILDDFGAAESNETDVAMEWMRTMQRTTPSEMPGMASPDDLTRLAQATGAEADKLFVTLMITHHQGGIHMADYAASHAHTRRVRDIAEAIVKSQTSEINDLQGVLAQLGT